MGTVFRVSSCVTGDLTNGLIREESKLRMGQMSDNGYKPEVMCVNESGETQFLGIISFNCPFLKGLL